MKKYLWIIQSFILLSSCTTYLNISKEDDYASYQKRKHVDVLYFETGRLDTFFFSEKYPGRLENGKVTGVRQVLLEYLNPDSVIFQKLTHPTQILYAVKEGVKYDILKENNRQFAFNLHQYVQVPFSEVNQMYVKVSRPYVSNLFLLAVTGASAGLAYMIITGMNDIGKVY